VKLLLDRKLYNVIRVIVSFVTDQTVSWAIKRMQEEGCLTILW